MMALIGFIFTIIATIGLAVQVRSIFKNPSNKWSWKWLLLPLGVLLLLFVIPDLFKDDTKSFTERDWEICWAKKKDDPGYNPREKELCLPAEIVENNGAALVLKTTSRRHPNSLFRWDRVENPDHGIWREIETSRTNTGKWWGEWETVNGSPLFRGEISDDQGKTKQTAWFIIKQK